MNKEEILDFMIQSMVDDSRHNLKIMGAAEDEIDSYLESNIDGINYLCESLMEKMDIAGLLNHSE